MNQHVVITLWLYFIGVDDDDDQQRRITKKKKELTWSFFHLIPFHTWSGILQESASVARCEEEHRKRDILNIYYNIWYLFQTRFCRLSLSRVLSSLFSYKICSYSKETTSKAQQWCCCCCYLLVKQVFWCIYSKLPVCVIISPYFVDYIFSSFIEQKQQTQQKNLFAWQQTTKSRRYIRSFVLVLNVSLSQRLFCTKYDEAIETVVSFARSFSRSSRYSNNFFCSTPRLSFVNQKMNITCCKITILKLLPHI